MYMQCGNQVIQAQFILKLTPESETNLYKVITFELEGVRMVRRLVVTVQQFGAEISVASPVGKKLIQAKVDDEFTIIRPDPEGYLVGKVLAIADSVAQAAA